MIQEKHLELLKALGTAEELDKFEAKVEKTKASITAAAYGAIGEAIALKRQRLR